MLMGGPIGCLIHAANVFEWPHNYVWEVPSMLMDGPIAFTVDAAAEFEWAFNAYG